MVIGPVPVLGTSALVCYFLLPWLRELSGAGCFSFCSTRALL